MKKLSDCTAKSIENGKKLTKFEMAYCLLMADSMKYGIFYDCLSHFKRAEIVDKFNSCFNTEIK